MNEYFLGKKLYGNDFSFDQIKQWYQAEAEGYANLGNKHKTTDDYIYHYFNKIHGFNKIKGQKFQKAMAFGAAWGAEIQPIIHQVSELIILEPSETMRSHKIGHLIPNYIKPQINGTIQMPDNTFDLITCFGTLHHIPNVEHVLLEMLRVLKPNGYLLMREPIISMGDWRKPRPGLTRNERGIPHTFFDAVFNTQPVQVVSKTFGFTATAFLQRSIGQVFKKSLPAYRWYVWFDWVLSKILKSNIHYHAQKTIQRIAPSSVFYVIRKTEYQDSSI